MEIYREEWLKVPNLLSYFRILLIPVFSYVYIQAQSTEGYLIAASILFLSGLTDALDGVIARQFNQITELGKILDPIADKLTQLAVAAVLMFRWPAVHYLFVLFLFKELSLSVMTYVSMKKGVVMDGAKWFGKIGTIVFYSCMFLLVIMPEMALTNVIILVTVTSIFQVIALLGYAKFYANLFAKTE